MNDWWSRLRMGLLCVRVCVNKNVERYATLSMTKYDNNGIVR